MTDFVDSHCHLDDPAFDGDRDAVLARARRAGVVAQIVPGVAAAQWPALKALCDGHRDLHPAYGLHPLLLDSHRPGHLDVLAHWLDRERPVALGEIGLDFHEPALDADAQRRWFRAQLVLALERSLPVIVHARRAFEEVMLTLRDFPGLRGVVHSYSGSHEQARQLVGMGFALGFGGPATYPGAHRIRRVLAELPLENLLVETDAPDQPLHGHQGERNEPCRVAEVVAAIARIRGDDEAAIASATAANTRRLFGLPGAETAPAPRPGHQQA
ncbi:MAG TPA: TatD family hydrolase [Xanthomonadaceae bacterium]|nr:TatD family hydrolase [Xanthomonadaceae bacterium]